MKSYIQRFIFDKLPLRGAFVVLDDAWQIIARQREYPEGLQQLLGELLAANVLLTSNLKFNGKIIIQIQDNPKLDFIVSECTHEYRVRATAKFTKGIASDYQIKYEDCLHEGMLVISIDSQNDGRLYQSVVALSGINLSYVITEYMLQSEQLSSFFVFAYTKEKIVGFMLQQLPDQANIYEDDIKRIFMLANTITRPELLVTTSAEMLQKLFNEDDIVLFDSQDVNFACTCSREKVSNMIRGLGKEEAESIIADEGLIHITCDFCNQIYIYDKTDVSAIFKSLCEDMESVSKSIH